MENQVNKKMENGMEVVAAGDQVGTYFQKKCICDSREHQLYQVWPLHETAVI